MKLYARFLQSLDLYKYHNAALREILTGAYDENRCLRSELNREQAKVEYLLIHRTLLTDELNELKGPKYVRLEK